MDSEFTEEEVVENPTLKAAYNLVPLHQKQPLQWDYEVELIGQKVFNKVIHLCEICDLPILLYGRLMPCKHIFCFNCSRKCVECKRCPAKVQKVEELALGNVYVCTYGAPKHSTKVCGRAYLSQRDLQSHFAHRHMTKPPSEVKTQNVQPQLPLTQQQAAALQHTSQPSAVNSQSSLLSSTNQQVMSSSSLIPSLGGLSASQESLQLLNHQTIPGLGDIQTAATSPIVSRASPGPKSSALLTHAESFNPQTNESSIFRALDNSSLPLQLQQHQHLQHLQNQQQQHSMQQHQQMQYQQQQHQLHHQQSPLQQPQQHLLQAPNQQPQTSQVMRLSGSPGLAPMSKSMPRFNQPQMGMSSSLLSSQGSHNPYQASSPGASDIQMSSPSQRRLQQSQNVNMHQQQLPGLMQQSHNQQPHFMQKNMDQSQSNTEMPEFYNRPNMGNIQSRDNFTNIQPRDNISGMLNRDEFNAMQQRKPFNSLQDEGFSSRQKMDNYNSPQQTRDNFNPRQMMDKFSAAQNRDNSMQGGLGDANPSPQGGLARNKNVNLITVPIQDEGQYRPAPFVGQQSQLPIGVGNNHNSTFTPNMPMPNSMSSNFSSHNQSNPRMPFQRPGNSLTRHSQPGNLVNNVRPNLNMMKNNPRGIGRGGAGMNLGMNVPANALATMVQALNAVQGGGAQAGPGVGQGGMMPNSGSHSSAHNPGFNASNSGGNNWSIQPHMTHNLPRPKGDGQFKPNYF